MASAQNSQNATNDHDEEFVVPHMDISCMQNSYAYQRILEEPWTYIHNWDSLTVNMQQAVMQSFIQELQEIKSGIAYTEGVFVGEAGDVVSQPSSSLSDVAAPAAARSPSPSYHKSHPSSSDDQPTSFSEKK